MDERSDCRLFRKNEFACEAMVTAVCSAISLDLPGLRDSINDRELGTIVSRELQTKLLSKRNESASPSVPLVPM